MKLFEINDRETGDFLRYVDAAGTANMLRNCGYLVEETNVPNSVLIEQGSPYAEKPMVSLGKIVVETTEAFGKVAESAEKTAADVAGLKAAFEARLNAMTKKELLELAGKANVRGRSRMTKDQLVSALREGESD